MAGFSNTALSGDPEGLSNVLLVQSEDNIKELETLKKLEFDQNGIDTCLDVSKYYIKGAITTAYPSFETKIRKTKKLVLKSCDPHQPSTSTGCTHSVSFFIYGENVNKCDILKPNDVVICKGFNLEKLSLSGHNFQILVNLQNTEAKIWIIKCKNAAPSQIKPVGETGVSHMRKTNTGLSSDPSYDKLQSSDDYEKSNQPEVTSSKGETNGTSNEQHKIIIVGGKKLRILQLTQKPQYIKLADCRCQTTVNFFAIVKFFKSPTKSKGTDYCMVISLVDDSFSSTEESFLCTVFSHDKELLPAIKCVGDIVRFEGVKIGKFNGAINGNARNLRSWLVFDGIPDVPITPTASSSNNYTLDEQDKKIIQNLKTWALLHDRITPKRMLSQIKCETFFFNLSCQIVSICEAVNADCLVLTVWDGTFPQYQSSSVEEIRKDTLVISNALKKESETMTIDVYLFDEHSQGEAKTLSPGDFVMLINVHAVPKSTITTLQVGNSDVISFIMHKGAVNGRGVYKLSLDCREVKEVNNQIASSKERRNINQLKEVDSQQTGSTKDQMATIPRTLQTSCTITDFPCIPFTSIEALKKSPKVPNKFRCRVKAISFLPNNIEDFVQRACSICKTLVPTNSSTQRTSKEPKARLLDEKNGPQDDASKQDRTKIDFDKSEENTAGTHNNPQEFWLGNTPICPVCLQQTNLVYIFSLLIEDPTGILHVMLFDSDVTDFLTDLPTPEEFLHSPETQQMIHDSLVSITDNQSNELTADSQPEGNRPWMECCVMSYKSHIDQVVLYRIFGTTLV